MKNPVRISPAEVRERADDLLLVCAYDDDAKFRQAPLEGGISFSRRRLPCLSKQQEIVFY